MECAIAEEKTCWAVVGEDEQGEALAFPLRLPRLSDAGWPAGLRGVRGDAWLPTTSCARHVFLPLSNGLSPSHVSRLENISNEAQQTLLSSSPITSFVPDLLPAAQTIVFCRESKAYI